MAFLPSSHSSELQLLLGASQEKLPLQCRARWVADLFWHVVCCDSHQVNPGVTWSCSTAEIVYVHILIKQAVNAFAVILYGYRVSPESVMLCDHRQECVIMGVLKQACQLGKPLMQLQHACLIATFLHMQKPDHPSSTPKSRPGSAARAANGQGGRAGHGKAAVFGLPPNAGAPAAEVRSCGHFACSVVCLEIVVNASGCFAEVQAL